MKKCLLLFVAVLLGVSVCGQALNPYAYDLRSSWNGTTRKLTISFMLNAKPNLDTSKGGAGIQIYAYDPSSPSTQYYICGPSGADINAKGVGPYSYTITFDANGKSDKTGVTVPLDTKLSWRVNVNGENQGSTNGRKVPTVVLDATANRPYKPYGVAVDNCTESPNFGQIYITEANNSTWASSSTWYWMNAYTRPCVWLYKPNLTIEGNITKVLQDGSSAGVSNFSDPEPHRVRVSADGRVFVSSFHNSSSVAVWEYTGGNNFNRIIARNKNTEGRVVGIDVTGSGNALKILVCYLTDNTLTFKEYPIGNKSGLFTGTATSKGSFSGTGIPQSNDFALANVAYNDNGDTFWFAWDTNLSETTQTKKSYVRQMIKNGATYQPADWQMTMPDLCGSSGLYVKGSLLVKATYNTSGGGTLRFYQIADNGALVQKYNPISVNTLCWVQDIAADFAGNLYFTSAYRANALAVAMPYNGLTVTPAPSDYTFTISDPIPNILATDLRYAPHPYLDSYYFSFNVNTKPAKAVFRFYESYDKMKQSISVVHDDLYDGTNATIPDFVYEVPASKLRQGKIEVEFKMAGGKIVGGKINEPILPPGEWYWSVYVEAPRRSTSFAPMYRMQGTVDSKEGNQRKHATVNIYPETDMFGAIIVAHNPQYVTNTTSYQERGLWICGINPDANNNDNGSSILSTNRYTRTATYLNGSSASGSNLLVYPRRLTVASDGKVYIADEGESGLPDNVVYHNKPDVWYFKRGGIKLWDPANPTKFTLYADNKIHTSTGVDIYEHGGDFNQWKMYAANTYSEFTTHSTASGDGSYYDETTQNGKFGWNGFVEYTMNKYAGSSWSSWGGNAKEVALKRGDASGNMSVVAMDKGVWMCQHREHTVNIKVATRQPLADTHESFVLSFIPYGATVRTWTTNNSVGIRRYDGATPVWDSNRSQYSQFNYSPLQSTPGAGMAYKKIKVRNNSYKEYIYVVNHDGNIAELEITGWAGTGATATPIVEAYNEIQILETPSWTKGPIASGNSYATVDWNTAHITTMNFDYAGNLVTTTGVKYWNGPQDIVIYTMPYPNRVNAQEIQAPNSCRFIPERLSQNDMNQEKIDDVVTPYFPTSGTCYLDLYRPLQGGTFNTITLPFDLASLNNTPYAGAEVRRFTGTELKNVGGENLLYFNFEKVTFSGDDIMKAGQPYVIMPQNDVVGIVSFNKARVQFKTQYSTELTGGDEYGKFVGFFPYREMASDPETLMLVSDNRLAEIEEGTMNGFRAYFHLLKAVPANTLSMLHFKKDAPTGMEIVVDGKVVNVEKLIREGRVYIRAGETLYTITGEVVGNRR